MSEERDTQVRRLLKQALQERSWNKVKDAARAMGGITFDAGFVFPEGMKAGQKPRRLSDEELNAALPTEPADWEITRKGQLRNTCSAYNATLTNGAIRCQAIIPPRSCM